MFRMLKAFAWMRWRMLANALEHNSSRDTLQRLSLAMENLGPIIAAVLLIPSALGLGALGIAAGYRMADGGTHVAGIVNLTRVLLLLVPVFVIIGPLVMPAADRTNPVRMLLLPIPRRTLYIVQSSATFGDPWTMLMVPLVLGVPIGLTLAGALVPAALAFAGALLLIVALVGLASLVTSIWYLVTRDRRRGELVALVVIIVLPLVGMVPGLIAGGSKRKAGQPRQQLLPTWTQTYGGRALALHPAQMFTAVTRGAVTGDGRKAARSLVELSAMTVGLHGLGLLAFLKVLNSPGSTGARRNAPMSTVWTRRIPRLTTGASAVALAQVRLAMRTTRGRSILLSPIAMLLIFGAMMYRGGGAMDFGPFKFGSGLGLATFAAAVCMISILPFAMNQFAVDGAGLTMTLLSPLPDAELLDGKAVGHALIVLPPILFSVIATLIVFPGGSVAMWVTLPLALLSIHFVVAPLAAIWSAMFPRVVNMNSIGRGSNAHGAAGLLGMLTFVVAALPAVLITLLATRLLQRPTLAPALMAVWCLVAYGIGRLLFRPARNIFAARRENLVMLG